MFGASGVFTELKDALNTIWGVRVKPGRALLRMARERVISFIMVLGVGFLLLLSLVVSATLTALDKSVDVLRRLPGPVWQGADIVLSLGIVTLLFGMIYKGLPNVRLRWRDVWTGAGCTAFLFTVGKFVIGVYLGTTGVASYYGAAGSAVVILLWVYYSACIVFYGAEFTKAYVVRDGRAVEPDERAVMRGGESLKK
jgi:membrane protein